jgi:hypothetical protein
MFFFSSSALLFSFPPPRLIGVVVEKRLKQLKCFSCCVCVSCELIFGFLCMASFQIIVVRFFNVEIKNSCSVGCALLESIWFGFFFLVRDWRWWQ